MDDNLVSGRMTRARGRRLSVESDSSSRPGTPVLAPKLQAINETNDSNTPNKPLRMTRRNSTTAVSTPVNTPTKTPGKSRAAAKRGTTPETGTPNKRVTRRRANSVTEEESTDVTKSIKTELQFETLPEEEESAIDSVTVKTEICSPSSNLNKPPKRVTRSASKSPTELKSEPANADKKSAVGIRRGRVPAINKVLDNIVDVDSDVEVIDRRSEERNNSIKKEQNSNTSLSIIEILDDTQNPENKDVSNESVVNIEEEIVANGQKAEQSSSERRKSQTLKDFLSECGEKTKESTVTEKDNETIEKEKLGESKELEKTQEANAKTLAIEANVQKLATEAGENDAEESAAPITTANDVHNRSGKEALSVEAADAVASEAQASECLNKDEQIQLLPDDHKNENDELEETKNTRQQPKRLSVVNPDVSNSLIVSTVAEVSPSMSTDLPTKADESNISNANKTASPHSLVNKATNDDSMYLTASTTTPMAKKRNYSASHKSVGFNDSTVEDTPKCSYPKTPAFTKTKSYIEIGSDDSFLSTNATGNKDATDEIIPETQEQNPDNQKEPLADDPGTEHANELKLNVENSVDSNNTPLKNIKKLQSIESSTPIANAMAQINKPSQELTPVPKVDKVFDDAEKTPISDEKSLRSGKRYSSSSTPSPKNNDTRNGSNLRESKPGTSEAEILKEAEEGKVIKELNIEGAETSKANISNLLKLQEAENVEVVNKDATPQNLFNRETWEKGITNKAAVENKIDAVPVMAQAEKITEDHKSTTITEEKSADSKQRTSLNNLIDHSTEERLNVTDDEYPTITDEEEELAEDEKPHKKHSFIDDEAMEVGSDYRSGDSMDEEERREIIENEVPIDGESLGSDDTHDSSAQFSEEETSADDSFIESDGDEGSLLEYSDSDEHLEGDACTSSKRKTFKRIMVTEETTDDDDDKGKVNEEHPEQKEQSDDTNAAKINDASMLENLAAGTEKISEVKDAEGTLENEAKSSQKITEEVQYSSRPIDSISDDDNASKLSETALKLCYTAEENSDNSSGDEGSRRDIIKKINQSEVFNKTIHELNTDPSETSAEITDTKNQSTSEKAKRKSLNCSTIAAKHEMQMSSDEEGNNATDQINDYKKRTSQRKSTKSETDDAKNNSMSMQRKSLRSNAKGSDTNVEDMPDSFMITKRNFLNKSHSEATSKKSLELCRSEVKTRKSLNDKLLCGNSKEEKVAGRNSMHEHGQEKYSSNEPSDQESEEEEENKDDIDEQVLLQATKQTKLPCKSINESLVTLNTKRNKKRNSLNKSQPPLLSNAYDEERDEGKNISENANEEKDNEYDTEEVHNVYCNNDEDDDSSGEENLMENDDSTEEEAPIETKIKKPKQQGLSVSLSERAQHNKQNRQISNKLHKSYTTVVEFNDSIVCNIPSHSTKYDIDDLEESPTSEDSTNKKYHADDEEQHALKKLDHIQQLFNPLSKTRRQSLALPSVKEDENESLTNKQLKRLKRQSLNVLPTADVFNPSQSLVYTTKLCQGEAKDSPKINNAKRKRLSKSFAGVGSLDTTVEETRHLNKKTKIALDNESDEEANQNPKSDNDEHVLAHVKSSTPHAKFHQELDSKSYTKKILDRCQQMLDAANQAKLEAKQNANKSKVKLKKQKKKGGDAVTQNDKLPSNKTEEKTMAVAKEPYKHHQEHEKVAAVKKAVMASAKILKVIPKSTDVNGNAVKPNMEQLKNKRRLPADVLEAISSSDAEQLAPPPRKKKPKIHQLLSPSSDQENRLSNKGRDARIQKSSAGIVVETALTPKKIKKQKPIETIDLPTGKMHVLPGTPKKKIVNGFEEALNTPKTIGFKVRQIMQNGQDVPPIVKPQKRKKQIVVQEPQYSLPKPNWTESGEFMEEHLAETAQNPYSRHILAKHKAAGTEVMLANLGKRKKAPKQSSSDEDYPFGINVNALNFKKTAQASVNREPARNLLLKKERAAAHNKF